MYSATEAIVLQLHPYKDNSAVVKLYSRQMGLVSCWVRSIRSKTSKTKVAILQPLSIINVDFSHKENNNMPQLKEITVAEHTPNIQLSIEKSSIALFLTELLLRTLKEASQDSPLYSFIRDSVSLLNSTDKKCTNFHLLFLVRYCDHLGFLPQENASVKNLYFDLQEGIFLAKEPMHPHFLAPSESKCLTELALLGMEDFYLPVIPQPIRKKLLHGLLEYFQLHLGISPLKSHLILEEVL
jgi:DNA repair protein RecO (recombination protein O)